MNQISREQIYEIMKASGWDNLENPTKDMQNFATRFCGRIYTLFKNEAQDILNAVNSLSHAPYTLNKKIEEAINGIAKIFDALDGNIKTITALNFQSVRARDGYLLYVSLIKAGASEEVAGKALNCFYLGKENILEEKDVKPIPDLEELVPKDIADRPKKHKTIWGEL